jgi:hypothetical protein
MGVAGVRTVTPFQVLGQYLFSEKWDKHHAALGSVLRRSKTTTYWASYGLRILLVAIVAHHEL